MSAPALFDHPAWEALLPFLYIRRDVGVNGARHRIEVRQDAPRTVFDLEVACAACGKAMHPVREDARHAWTFNVSCPLAVNYKCARMRPSTVVASAVRARIEALGFTLNVTPDGEVRTP